MEGNNEIKATAHVVRYYKIDWDKVKTLEDIKLILSTMDSLIGDNHKDFEKIEKFTKSAGE